jgi:hypothetical protein
MLASFTLLDALDLYLKVKVSGRSEYFNTTDKIRFVLSGQIKAHKTRTLINALLETAIGMLWPL